MMGALVWRAGRAGNEKARRVLSGCRVGSGAGRVGQGASGISLAHGGHEGGHFFCAFDALEGLPLWPCGFHAGRHIDGQRQPALDVVVIKDIVISKRYRGLGYNSKMLYSLLTHSIH